MTKYEKEISIMAKNRSIKVVSQSGYNYKATPTITLKFYCGIRDDKCVNANFKLVHSAEPGGL